VSGALNPIAGDVYSRLVGEAEGKRTLQRTGSRWYVKITSYPIVTGL
jgi:hypothetical protein